MESFYRDSYIRELRLRRVKIAPIFSTITPNSPNIFPPLEQSPTQSMPVRRLGASSGIRLNSCLASQQQRFGSMLTQITVTVLKLTLSC
jgi:hypothetical protein